MAPTNLGISNIKSLATADPFDGNVSNLLEGVSIAGVKSLEHTEDISFKRITSTNGFKKSFLAEVGGRENRLAATASVVSGSNVGVLSHGGNTKIIESKVGFHVVKMNRVKVDIQVGVGGTIGEDNNRLDGFDALGARSISDGTIDRNIDTDTEVLLLLCNGDVEFKTTANPFDTEVGKLLEGGAVGGCL